MKIGILTYHHGRNHGGFLQTYALQKTLGLLGYENRIINYRNPRHYWKEVKMHIRPRRRKFNRVPTWLKFHFSHKLLEMTPLTFSVNRVRREYFDCVLLGSDEIWNYKNRLFGFDPIYFGNGLNAGRIASYAASFGSVNAGESILAEVSQSIKKLTKISVRDTNSQKIVRGITGEDVQIFLDPAFLYDFESEECVCPYNNFILVYTTGEGFDQRIDQVRSLAKYHNKKIISIGYENPWCDINKIVLDPFDWLGYFRKADMVVTSMFHGTVFSLKYNKPFCTVITPYRTNKFSPMLMELGVLGRVAKDNESVMNVFRNEIDFNSVNGKIDSKVLEAFKFLREIFYDAET